MYCTVLWWFDSTTLQLYLQNDHIQQSGHFEEIWLCLLINKKCAELHFTYSPQALLGTMSSSYKDPWRVRGLQVQIYPYKSLMAWSTGVFGFCSLYLCCWGQKAQLSLSDHYPWKLANSPVKYDTYAQNKHSNAACSSTRWQNEGWEKSETLSVLFNVLLKQKIWRDLL